MSLILILIAYYLDYKSETDTFWSDLKGGLFVVSFFIINALLLKFALGFHFLNVIFITGIELILLFVFKAMLQKKH